jgi:hypothetical protein
MFGDSGKISIVWKRNSTISVITTIDAKILISRGQINDIRFAIICIRDEKYFNGDGRCHFEVGGEW